MSNRLGWNLGFSNVMHLVDERKTKLIPWGTGKIAFTYCGLITDGFGGYDADDTLQRWQPYFRLCRVCEKAEKKHREAGE